MPSAIEKGDAARFSIVVENVQVTASTYLLEGEFAYPECTRPAGAVVLAGPHPLLGGNMHNNVVRGLGDGLAERGFATFRFNYRGVGHSQGPAVDVARHIAEFWQTSHVPGEMDLWQDVQGAADFVREAVGPDLPMALLGYSFGCALLPSVRAQETAPLVLIAPTIGKHDYDTFLPVPGPTLVIASEDDFATDAEKLQSWFKRLAGPKYLLQKRLDNHFFRGHESWLVEMIDHFLREQWR
jgi:uncharacterized protein